MKKRVTSIIVPYSLLKREIRDRLESLHKRRHINDVVEMASYAPLFVNYNDRGWESDAIVFDSWQHYGTPSYWAQQFFKESSGAFLLPSEICENSTNHIVASALTWHRLEDDAFRLKIKVSYYLSL
ncbi:Alpha-L-arabinofuranosidase 1 [Nymphaea thermarum]|nr:Alpha-L-arabinofuranosidase 1 [Nymphaea thermarum]